MLPKVKLLHKLVVLVSIVVFALLPGFLSNYAYASLSACEASVSISNVDSGSSNGFVINVKNKDDATGLVWIKITRPSSNFTITGTDFGDFTSSDVTYGGTYSIGPQGGQTNVTVTASAGSFGADSANWTVQASDDSTGASPTACSGDLGTSINGPDAVSISNISVSDVTSSSVKVTWTTNSNTDSTVNYGETAEYGATKSDSASVTTHSLNLDGLSANTTYHYKISSSNSDGSAQSGDNTFVTAAAGETGTTQSGTSTTSTSTTTTTTTTVAPKVIVDSTPPAVSIVGDFSKPFKTAPLISGRSSDNTAVSRVEYSIDDGKNWLPADTINSVGAKATGFSFTPVIFEDGNYRLRARAKDPAGNIGVSDVSILIIDRLPPQIGGTLYSTGPQPLVPDKNGVVFTFPGLEQKITLSAVGGPITIDIESSNQTYSLVKNVDNGLWSGALSFTKPGVYELIAKAVDGADNRTERQLNTVVVLGSGKVTSGTSPVSSGDVTLWYFDNQTQRFVVWDGDAYGQANPEKISKNGEYGFYAPAGKYYLEVRSPGFRTLKSEIFVLNSATPITSDLRLEKSFEIYLGPFVFSLPDLFVSKQVASINPPTVPSDARILTNTIIGDELLNMDLFSNGNKISTITFRGKPTVLTFLSTWSPYAVQQLKFIGEISGNSQINVVPIVSQESSTSVAVFAKRGGYSFPIFSDPDGLLVKPLNLSFLPTNIFVNRKGIVQGVKVGVLTKDEILENMVN